MILALLAIAAAQAPAMPSSPDPAPPTTDGVTPPRVPDEIVARFAACTDLVRSDPERAVEVASAWRVDGGGIYARQCLGLAYVALERWAPAATAFEQAARDAQAAGDVRRGDFWVQSGNAWLAGGEPTRAVQAFDEALAAPGLSNALKGEVHLDRARALVALNNPAGARDDLNEGLRLVPEDPFAWYLSAALARRQGDAARARTDIARARELAPDNPDIMLLAGTLAGEGGDMAEAERLYRRVAEGAPNTDAGRAAQASLATARETETPAAAPAQPPAPQPARPAPQPAPTPQSQLR
ncbi:tetratricopeptide repeat protein [Sphingosinicella sp. LHD-64]|uniref:tetratricopeptide repeat protein n=1 Tax=Sphingosinicella sp. LHD-64 TaxID=3072139 RepID=UPI00280D5326|nr:tetratricopeptide repeat protein [Sphingosinicella sp. LHD-64]MDQ8756986.1 tetratricopeptide repeat protein [Sphingosinicella sp. LHD-64]